MTDFETKLLELESEKVRILHNISADTIRTKEALNGIYETMDDINSSLVLIHQTIWDTNGSAEMGNALKAIANFSSSDYSYELNIMNDRLEELLKIMKQED